MATPTSFLATNPASFGESTAADHNQDAEIGMSGKPDSPQDTKAGPSATVQPPFSVFTRGEKWALVMMAAAAGPLSANIYFPAIPLLANDFRVSVSLMNLTITVYLIFQGISPMLWAPLADTYGRRPVYLTSGSASTVALASGVVADIATPSERGGFLGFTTLGVLLGPCIGPVIGGLLAGGLGWRWIFWFLCILSTVCLTFIYLFLPETLRRIVGNGSQPAPKWWGRPLVPLIGPSPRRHRQTTATPPQKPKHRPNAFRLFLEPDIIFMLLSTALTYCLFVTIQSTTSLLFQQAYYEHPDSATSAKTQMIMGLCFLPMGVGCLMSSVVTGKQLDVEYKRCRAKWEEERKARWMLEGGRRMGGEGEKTVVDEEAVAVPPPSKEEELTFHVEKARLRWSFLYTGLTVASCIGYGWTLDKRTHMAVPLAIQFVAGWVVVGQMNSFQTLLIDVFPAQGSSTTAIHLGSRMTDQITVSYAAQNLKCAGSGWKKGSDPLSMMLMNYLYGSSKATTDVQENTAVAAESPSPDGDLVIAMPALNDETPSTTIESRLQAPPADVHGNPNKDPESARKLDETPTSSSTQSSMVSILPVILEQNEGAAFPTHQPSLGDHSRSDLGDALAEDSSAGKQLASSIQIRDEPVMDNAEEHSDVLKLWMRVRDSILLDESPLASTARANTVNTDTDTGSTRPPYENTVESLSNASSHPFPLAQTSSVEIPSPGPLRSYFSDPLISTSPERGRFVELFDAEDASVVSSVDKGDTSRGGKARRSVSGMLSRWRRNRNSRL
ncbi:hypothetical protein FRB90_003658 [Tulasnella sp. 427]|nr:hypothetical protein FRB90_003658 [Tulasnella sp. 427]